MTKEEIREYANENLTKKRLIHTLGVVDQAIALCQEYGANTDNGEIAALCHDLFRGKTQEELNRWVDRYSLGEKYKNNPNLSHGKIAASFAKYELGIEDEDILNAISYHTTGREKMSLLEKIVFIADAIELGRDYPQVEDIREMAYKELDKACLMSLEGTVNHLTESGMDKNAIDGDTIKAIDYFKGIIDKD